MIAFALPKLPIRWRSQNNNQQIRQAYFLDLAKTRYVPESSLKLSIQSCENHLPLINCGYAKLRITRQLEHQLRGKMNTCYV